MTDKINNQLNTPSVFLKKSKVGLLKNRHPWIFSGALVKGQPLPSDGSIVHVYAEDTDVLLAIGHFQSSGSISVRILSRTGQHIDRSFFIDKIKTAYDLRQVFIDRAQTNCFRLVHGEGDGLPGLIVDYYDGHVVFQCHSLGMFLQRDIIAEALDEVMGNPAVIYCKSSNTMHQSDTDANVFMKGEATSAVVIESGIKLSVDWVKGQKTGTFLDQRSNRAILQKISDGRTVLDLFCNNGGFSLNALAGGAAHVTSVDSSATALHNLQQSIELNHFDPSRHTAIQSDCQAYLKSVNKAFDIVICDPPAFAKSLSKKHKAVQGYKRLNISAIKAVKSEGLLLSFSCSQAVDDLLFYNTIVAAALESGRQIKVLSKLQQGVDHPVNIFHREGSYLKGLLLQII